MNSIEIPAKELEVFPVEAREVRGFIEEYHYSRSINGVKITQCYAVKHREKLVGGILFGQMATTAWKKFGDSEGEVLELRRLVLLDECGRNSESRVISLALRHLRSNYPEVKVIVSYADPHHGHKGTIYKASNFTYLGESAADWGFQDMETGRVYHSRALRTKYKGEYKPFVKRLRAKREAGELVEIRLPGKHCYVYYMDRKKHHVP